MIKGFNKRQIRVIKYICQVQITSLTQIAPDLAKELYKEYMDMGIQIEKRDVNDILVTDMLKFEAVKKHPHLMFNILNDAHLSIVRHILANIELDGKTLSYKNAVAKLWGQLFEFEKNKFTLN